MQIGEVAEKTSLSLRTIRYYEEVGLAPPSARTTGGFRLYTEGDVERLQLIKRMKPLDFSLDEVRDLLAILDELDAGRLSVAARRALVERLEVYRAQAEERVATLRARLAQAESFTSDLARHTG